MAEPWLDVGLIPPLYGLCIPQFAEPVVRHDQAAEVGHRACLRREIPAGSDIGHPLVEDSPRGRLIGTAAAFVARSAVIVILEPPDGAALVDRSGTAWFFSHVGLFYSPPAITRSTSAQRNTTRLPMRTDGSAPRDALSCTPRTLRLSRRATSRALMYVGALAASMRAITRSAIASASASRPWFPVVNGSLQPRHNRFLMFSLCHPRASAPRQI